MEGKIQVDGDNPLLTEVGEHLPGVQMSPATGIAALAMNFALKFCELNTISDGTLYQQMKLEGVNIRPGWHLEEVFSIARQIELQLLTASNRLTDEVMEAIAAAIVGEEDGAASEDAEPEEAPPGDTDKEQA